MNKKIRAALFAMAVLMWGCGDDNASPAAVNPGLGQDAPYVPPNVPDPGYPGIPSVDQPDLPGYEQPVEPGYSQPIVPGGVSSAGLGTAESSSSSAVIPGMDSESSSSSSLGGHSSSSLNWLVSSSSEEPSSSSVAKRTLDEEIQLDRQYVAAGNYSEFQSVSNVMNQVQPDQKIVFVLRHAERGDDFSKWGQLTENGKQQSRSLGRKLNNGVRAFYGSSPFVRTRDTGRYIAMERGDLAEGADFTEFAELESLGDDWYVKDMNQHEQDKNQMGGGWQLFSKWSFEGGYEQGFYDIGSRSVELITQQLLPSIPSEYRMGIFISHDKVLVPLVAYCTDRKVDMRYWQNGKWTENLQGLAIIVNEDGSRKYIPVDGLK